MCGGARRAIDLSYVSRLCSADAFIRLATLPTYERGTRSANTVVAVMDSGPWLQELIDEQCPDAVRILDFPHAVEYLARAAQAAFGPRTREASVWLETWAPRLKREGPDGVLATLHRLPMPDAAAATVRTTALHYLRARRAQLAHPCFQERGYPIGSGIAESACKVVVEQRLKGSGVHWKRANVSPMLALRAVACSDRWDVAWPRITAFLHQQRQERRHARWQERHPPPQRPRLRPTCPTCRSLPVPSASSTATPPRITPGTTSAPSPTLGPGMSTQLFEGHPVMRFILTLV